MAFRFVDEHDPTPIHQAESSQTVDSAADADDVQTRLDDNLSIIDTVPVYYDEEIVDAHSSEEREDQTESRSPDALLEYQSIIDTGGRYYLLSVSV
ncbi:Uncharacterized protein HZ326_7591 [Fusarium oxysporum f. sp. albedinis]|nr:Uncharacterized protein HZ326_7591 [Fusarium oxysporum f. sp. albedinis]